MLVTIKVVGGLAVRLGFTEQQRDLPAGATAGTVLAALGIADPHTVITTRNGRGVAPDEPLAEGDRVLVAPPFSGG